VGGTITILQGKLEELNMPFDKVSVDSVSC
jgi:hypothetical protein